MPHKSSNAIVKVDWQSKTSTNRAGKPWCNKGHLMERGKCKIHKGQSFGQLVARSSADAPTRSAKQELAMEAAKKAISAKDRLIAALQKDLAAAQATSASGASSVEVVAEMEGAGAKRIDRPPRHAKD